MQNHQYEDDTDDKMEERHRIEEKKTDPPSSPSSLMSSFKDHRCHSLRVPPQHNAQHVHFSPTMREQQNLQYPKRPSSTKSWTDYSYKSPAPRPARHSLNSADEITGGRRTDFWNRNDNLKASKSNDGSKKMSLKDVQNFPSLSPTKARQKIPESQRQSSWSKVVEGGDGATSFVSNNDQLNTKNVSVSIKGQFGELNDKFCNQISRDDVAKAKCPFMNIPPLPYSKKNDSEEAFFSNALLINGETQQIQLHQQQPDTTRRGEEREPSSPRQKRERVAFSSTPLISSNTFSFEKQSPLVFSTTANPIPSTPLPKSKCPSRSAPLFATPHLHQNSSLNINTPSSNISLAGASFATLSTSSSSPKSEFITSSISALQNDIGTLLARSNRVDEALDRYALAISSATGILDKLDVTNDKLLVKDNENKLVHDDDNGCNRIKKCSKVREVEGLAWFHQKLLRGDIVEEMPLYNYSDSEKIIDNMNSPGSHPVSEINNQNSKHAEENRPPIPPTPPPFQPAGFGGCALHSPRRIRSASFCIVDLKPRYDHKQHHPDHQLRSDSLVEQGVLKENDEVQQPNQETHVRQQSHHSFTRSLEPLSSTSSRHPSTAQPPPPLKENTSSFGGGQPMTYSPKRTFSSKITAIPKCPQTAPYPPKPTILLPRSNSMNRQYQRSRTMSSSSFHSLSQNFHQSTTKKPTIAPLDDIVHDIHHHQKLDCSDDVYSCNGRTPLGLDYVCDPLPVLGGMLRKLVLPDSITGEKVRDNAHNVAGSSGKIRNRNNTVINTAVMEYAALVAARLNTASLEYRKAGGGINDNLQNVLETLRLALCDCHSIESIVENLDGGFCKSKIFELFGLLKVVAHVNIGTVLYRLNKVRDGMASLESAKVALENWSEGSESTFESLADLDMDDRDVNEHDESHPHDDNRFPPRAYLLLVLRLNLSRVSLRVNNPNGAEELCKLIAQEASSSNQRRKSSRNLPPRNIGFHRSNSFSITSSALAAASAAYQHDIDRRSKWLCAVAEHYLAGLVHEARGESSDYKSAANHYNRLLSLARVKLDHRHPYICALLERRGAVLFEQRKLQCSMLSYLACLKILEHQQATGSNVFNKADLARVLYGIARVLHDKEDYLDALHMYQRALSCQRALAVGSSRPTLDVITTLCNISRVHHLMGDIDAALAANQEVLQQATILVNGKMDHPFLINRLKIEGNILVEAGRVEDAMRTFIEAARRCCDNGRDRMINTLMGGGSNSRGANESQEDSDAGDSSVLSIRSATSMALIAFLHPSAAAA
ncbi:hypothetical protein ACHAXS_008609 [Conticribra weissflogii]